MPYDLVGGGGAEKRKKSHVVLTEREIDQRLGQEVDATAEVFCVPADWALALLVHYRWDSLRLHEEWFAEQDRIRDAVGLGCAAAAAVPEIVTCGICLEAKPAAKTFSAGCEHLYCHDCWRGYVAAALEGGNCFLAPRCPDPSCSRAVLRGAVERFATRAGKGAYARALARSYVEARHRRFKLCNAPGCGLAIELAAPGADGGGEFDDADLECPRCGNAFCWRCGGAPHWPAGCAEAARWAHDADGASAGWLLLHTKPCPRCQRPIERVGGCDNMECAPPCRHRFCWGCLAPTPEYGADVWRRCERSEQPEAATEEKARARMTLDRFLYYQELRMDNLRERRNAEAELRKLRGHERFPLPWPRGEAESGECMEMVAAAWEQVAEGRRVLGNACAHGQRLREAADVARWELFEFQYRETDAMLGRLQELTAMWAALDEPMVFRGKLAELTGAARRGVENFTKAVEDGMPEVCIHDGVKR